MPLFEGSPTISSNGTRRSRTTPATITRRAEPRLRRVVADGRIADLLGINAGQEVGGVNEQRQALPSRQLDSPDFYSDPRILDNLADTLSSQSFYDRQGSPLQQAIALQSVLAGLAPSGQTGFSSGSGAQSATANINGSAAPTATGSASSVLAAIGVQESGNNYNAVGPVNSGGRGTAKGKYQFIDSTWRYAARLAGVDISGHPTGLAPPEVQEAVAGGYANYLMRKYGSAQLVAIAWHAGEGAADKAARNGGRTSAFDAAAGISTQAYAANVVRNS